MTPSTCSTFALQDSPYWEIAAGYVGALKAEIPFTNLYSQSVSLTLDEALLTLRPRPKTGQGRAAPEKPSEQPASIAGLALLICTASSETAHVHALGLRCLAFLD
jgi:hypothetical protein